MRRLSSVGGPHTRRKQAIIPAFVPQTGSSSVGNAKAKEQPQHALMMQESKENEHPTIDAHASPYAAGTSG